MTDIVTPSTESHRWTAYISPRSPLTTRLTAEFARHLESARPEPLAVFGHHVLLQPPDALPVLRCETPGGSDLVLDFGDEAGTDPEFLLGGVAVDATGVRIAYTVDRIGDDRYELRIAPGRTLRTGVSPAVAWHTSAEVLVHVVLDDTMRPAEVHAVRPDGSHHGLLYRAQDESAYLDLAVSGDGETVFVLQERHGTRSVQYLDDEAHDLLPLWNSATGERVIADATPEQWVLLRTGNGPDEVLVADRTASRGPTNWTTVATAGPGHVWEDLTIVDGAAYLVERGGGGQQLLRLGLEPSGVERVSFTPVDDRHSLTIVPGLRRTGLDVLRGSWREPDRWFRVRPGDLVAMPVHDGSVRPPEAIEVIVLSVPSSDGTPVPLTLLRPAGSIGALPTVLFAYGAYGVAIDPRYSPFRASLLERGVAFAVAHVRGGGDNGPAWYDAGRAGNKPRAVEDYLACAAALTSQGWADPAALVARSRSAGAAIVGAALNVEPERFAAVVLEMPFLDCFATLSDPERPLTSIEWDEWGNPLTDPVAAAALHKLSPVDNVRAAAYPPILLTAGASDSRVCVTEALLFAAKVRDHSTSAAPVLVKIDDTGHLGHSDVAADHQDEADVLAFILDHLGRAVNDIEEPCDDRC